MFRRKEEGLFDNDMDQNQMLDEAGHDEKSVSQPAASFSTPSPASSPAPSAFAQPIQRPAAQATTSSANSFRPATASPAAAGSNATAPTTSETITRNRTNEAKPMSAINTPTPSFPATTSSNLGDKTKSGQRVLTVGNDILLKGEIATCDRLVIEGKVDATLNDVHTVEIAECGSFKGAAQIENAEISGLFEGELTVRGRLVIYASGKVRGKISYGEIEIERGGEMSGEIKMVGGAASVRPAPRNAAKEEKVAA